MKKPVIEKEKEKEKGFMGRYRAAFGLLLFTLALTFFLVCWGGIVKSTESSLGCPDWPLCHGQVIPETSHMSPEKAREIFWEQGHRLIATMVGFCAILILVLLWNRADGKPSLRGKAMMLLGLIVFQGLLGAATVMLHINPIISAFHLAVSMIILMLEVVLVRDTCIYSRVAPPLAPWPSDTAVAAKRINHIVLILIFFQIVLGATVRHYAGSTWAAGSGPAASVLGIDTRTGEYILFSKELSANINLLHRYFAWIVAALVIYCGIVTWLRIGLLGKTWHKVLIWLPTFLIFMQVLVGIGMIAMKFLLFMRTMHLGVAALALIFQLLLTIEIARAARARTGACAMERTA